MNQNFATYDFHESWRQGGEWLGATAKAFWSNPAFGLTPNPLPATFAAWGQVTERTFARMVARPDWGIDSVVTAGREYVVRVETVLSRAFGDLIQFRVDRPEPPKRRVLLVAPMSGHYATLLRKTVVSLLPNCDVFITDWHNARDIPVSEGKFDIEDFTLYLVDFMAELGRDIHVIAVCQPAPLALAATALLAESRPRDQPRTLTLIGGPIDPDAAPTEVTDFGRRVTMGHLEKIAIQRVGVTHRGFGRLVYPGASQLASFISMNPGDHATAFANQIGAVAREEAADHDRHNAFYDEYLAVMDMTAEFYLSTVQRIFKGREIAENRFFVGGRHADISKITSTAIKTVEGLEDDITAPGQCIAALGLLTGLPASMKASHVEPGTGHYGIFSGRAWRENIRPLVLDFIDANAVRPAA
ncbi:MAG: polyhydroxyalkanoate depolymerase [Paracoccaceae bacterium]